ncbi:MAG: hypothetical protein R2705_12705 [Ilumatobacteraceae bacterium]
METTTIGVLGSDWRASVTPTGAIEYGNDERLDWWVAADDRWHDPAVEATVRQACLGGTPVVETRVRVPQGDVIQRVYAVADHGGFTILEFENASPLPVAVALGPADLAFVRPPSTGAATGIELPAGSTVHPMGHRSVIRIGLRHRGGSNEPLPADLPPVLAVQRGWETQVRRAGRVVLPDEAWVDAVTAARCEVALVGLDDPTSDPVRFLLGAHELARLGADVAPWVGEIATAAERIARSGSFGWAEDRALLAAGAMFAADDDHRAVADVERLRIGAGARRSAALAVPPGITAVAWVEDQLARPRPGAVVDLLPNGVPSGWEGQNFEAHGLPAGPAHRLSYAVRWHGRNLAVLWELAGPGPLTMTASAVDPTWSSSEPAGEGLLRPA